MVYDFHQDDPRKCTSVRLRKFHLIQPIFALNRIPRLAVVLNPSSDTTLTTHDRELVSEHGLIVIDCSWNRAQPIFRKRIRGENRKLPPLLAGNPTNYGIIGKLSSAEAVAAALIITGFKEQAEQILSLFKWGHTFTSLNQEPLESYAAGEKTTI